MLIYLISLFCQSSIPKIFSWILGCVEIVVVVVVVNVVVVVAVSDVDPPSIDKFRRNCYRSTKPRFFSVHRNFISPDSFELVFYLTNSLFFFFSLLPPCLLILFVFFFQLEIAIMLDCESINSSSPLGLDLGFLLLFERKSILFKSRRLSGSFQSTSRIIEARWSAIESWRTVGRKENFDHLPTTLGSLFDFFLLRHKGGLRLFLLRMRIQNHFLSLSSDLILSEILQVFDWRCCVWPEPGCEPGSS